MCTNSFFNLKYERIRFLSWLAFVLILVSLIMTFSVSAERIFPGNPYSHRVVVDPLGKFVLEYIADPKNSDVVFNITAETRGYVAIGFSKTGMMPRSDIVIGGVNNNGAPYLSDRHTIDDRVPLEDIQQDWKLARAWENATHTSLRIVRDVETCDPQDYPINDDMIHLLWAFGEDDTIDYHFNNRGSFPTYLFQPDLSPDISPSKSSRSNSSAPSDLDVWQLSVGLRDSVNGSSWCVFQRGPEIEMKKHYIIGFSTKMDSEMAKKSNLDRILIYKCYPDRSAQNNEEAQQKFQQLVDYGGECKNAKELFSYCKDIFYTWGRGGKPTFLPKNTGVPFGEKDEYYLLEALFSHPNLTGSSTEDSSGQKNPEFDVNIDFLLTQSARKFEPRILRVGHDPKTPLVIPPGSLDFEVFGHCASECTERMIPKRKPLRVFGVSFDTGQSGKKATLHQIRNAHQIPLILQDANFDPSFQQLQILRDETPIRPGDQVTVRCTFDTTFRTGMPTPKLSTSSNSSKTPERRCLAYLWYYHDSVNNTNNVSPQYVECTSVIHPGDFYKWIADRAPKDMLKRNLDPEFVSKLNKLKWTPGLRASLYNLYKYSRYRTSCGKEILPNNNNNTNVPNVAAKPNNNGTKVVPTNRRNNGTLNKAGVSKPAAAGEITVYPLPAEEIPYTVGCSTLNSGLPARWLPMGPPGPVIFGFP